MQQPRKSASSPTSCSAATGFEFEGVEKKLELEFFFKTENADKIGLRALPKEKWQTMLSAIKCNILSVSKNTYFDAYVLSESSLFVYPTKVIVKTCGTTRTLLCLDYILSMASSCDLEVEFVFFSRKNFRNPQLQHFPHTSFDSEVEYLNKYFNGEGYVLGSPRSDHWNLYLFDTHLRKSGIGKQTLEIMMTELDEDVMKQFYRNSENPVSDKEITSSSGIGNLLPGSATDEFLFDPCGYSVNGLLNQAYFTIHITPEPSCSFVSFETNLPLVCYKELVERVVFLFKPRKFQVSLFMDQIAHDENFRSVEALPGRDDVPGFKLRTKSYYEFEKYDVTVCNYCPSQ
eukprot:TRINITY_DN15979_c0_g1_i1.p1 TRINITY_DN15979_c0_g1~~TRINITY_DN15979_c0_g1_i1.p1  ORF type:complete len:345 (-),score=40.59 TRINITY_DN15979_c0_g1_i1:20-1054(-)